MKTPIIIVIAALTLIASADKLKSPTAVRTQRTYEVSVQTAGKRHRQSLKTAQDEYRKQLKEASEAALEANDLNAANEIEAALKAIEKKKPFVAPTFQLGIEAQRTHEDSVQAANEQHLDALKRAEEVYIQEMQAGLDAAIAAKDLPEAKRVDAAMKVMQQKIDTRIATGKLVFSTITNSIGMTFVLIPAGEFTMGSPASEPGRFLYETQHPVRLTAPFLMGIHEVTQSQYEAVMFSNPSKLKGENNPVEQVSSNDAVEFCAKLSALPGEVAAGRVFRLPTEAEWEYACRAGTTTAYSFGDTEKDLGQYTWFSGNSGNRSHAVGEKRPNGWGLYDVHGNVSEWCEDKVGSSRVIRGGSCMGSAASCRAAGYHRVDPSIRLSSIGFRLALSSPSAPSPEADK